MASPTPRPQPQPSPGNANSRAADALGTKFVPPMDPSGSSGGNIYGLDGAVAGAPINAGGLFPSKPGATVLDTVTQFSHLTGQQAAILQRRLYLSGYYGANSQPVFGHISGDDISAFKKAATDAAQTGTDLDLMLRSGAARGQYDGVASALAAQLKAKQPNQITKADPLALKSNVDSAFQSIIGRKATDAEKAAFVSAFQAADLANQQGNINSLNAANDAQQAAIDNASGLDPALSSALAPNDANVPDPRVPTPGSSAAFRMAEEQSKGTYSRPDITVDQFMQALQGQESDGNSFATNPSTGAYGRFQIMPGNWSSWAREAGLGANAPQTPGNQEVVARHKLQQYYQQYGTWQAVAAAWYGGPGAAQKYLKNPDDPRLSVKQGKGNEPSINQYVHQVTNRLLGVTAASRGAYEYSSPVTPGANVPTPSYTTQAFNDQAFTENYARTKHPLEAAGHDVANTFDAFTQILQGR